MSLLLDNGEESGKIHGRRRPLLCRSSFALPLASAAAVLFVAAAAVRLLSSTMEGASHRQQAFLMSLGAGMSTGIGASFVLCTTSINPTLLACTMAFSSGVMLYIPLVEVIGVANEYLAKLHPPAEAYGLATLSFFCGVAPWHSSTCSCTGSFSTSGVKVRPGRRRRRGRTGRGGWTDLNTVFHIQAPQFTLRSRPLCYM